MVFVRFLEALDLYFVITLPPGWFLAAGMPESFAHAVLKGQLVSESKAMKGDEARFEQWEADLHADEATGKRAALLEIQARLLRMAQSLPRRTRARAADPNLSKADQLACHIAQNDAEPLMANDIAKASGLHANYAMKLFLKAFATTMTDFITQHRLSHAQRLLVTTDDPVIEIAFASGFQSLSRFNEAFKRACTSGPRDYRKVNQHRA